MEATVHETTIIGDASHEKITRIDFGPVSDKLNSIALENMVKLMLANQRSGRELTLSASGEDLREVTGEDILEATRLAGGRVEYTVDDEGLIDSISASVQTSFEYDAHEMGEVLESLQATGVTPSKLVGDLAQASVGATGSEQQVLGLSEWTITWKRKTVDATTTDDDTYESSLASTASWDVKAKFMFIDGDPSQATNLLATIGTPQAAVPWNFFPTIAAGRAAFTGNAYVDGLTIASGMGKVVALDVSLKGTGPLKTLSQAAPQTSTTVTGQQAEV